jgi:ATP-dependent Clp protease ATP-binding subunit ClpA
MIELTDETRVAGQEGLRQSMGARPMARVIQAQINEAGVKKITFDSPEGPAQPRLERDIIVAAAPGGHSSSSSLCAV